MAVNARDKGCRGEREWSQYMRETWGIQARRGCQFAGNPDAPDVITDLDGVHFEVKRVEKLSLNKAMDQASRDSGVNIPCVAHRTNRRPWLVTIKADDLLEFCKRLSAEVHWSA